MAFYSCCYCVTFFCMPALTSINPIIHIIWFLLLHSLLLLFRFFASRMDAKMSYRMVKELCKTDKYCMSYELNLLLDEPCHLKLSAQSLLLLYRIYAQLLLAHILQLSCSSHQIYYEITSVYSNHELVWWHILVSFCIRFYRSWLQCYVLCLFLLVMHITLIWWWSPMFLSWNDIDLCL